MHRLEIKMQLDAGSESTLRNAFSGCPWSDLECGYFLRNPHSSTIVASILTIVQAHIDELYA